MYFTIDYIQVYTRRPLDSIRFILHRFICSLFFFIFDYLQLFHLFNGSFGIARTIVREVAVKRSVACTVPSAALRNGYRKSISRTLIVADRVRLQLIVHCLVSIEARLDSFGLPTSDPSGLLYRGDRNAAYRNRGMWVTVMCRRRRPAGAAAASRIDDRPIGRPNGESARIRRKSTTRRSGRNWAPRRNGAPSIPAGSARGSSSFLLQLLLLLPPICDHRRRHRDHRDCGRRHRRRRRRCRCMTSSPDAVIAPR